MKVTEISNLEPAIPFILLGGHGKIRFTRFVLLMKIKRKNLLHFSIILTSCQLQTDCTLRVVLTV